MRSMIQLAGSPQARLARAMVSPEALSLGDALGERYFGSPAEALRRISERALPPAPWRYTDDTVMALAVVQVLRDHGRIDQDALAANFALRYGRNRHRGYGATAHEILEGIGRGVPWRLAASGAFGGQGSRGNGAAMRVAPLGAYFADDLDRVVHEAGLSAEVTHAHLDGKAGDRGCAGGGVGEPAGARGGFRARRAVPAAGRGDA